MLLVAALIAACAEASALAKALTETDAEGIVLSLLYINEPGDLPGWPEAAPGRFIGAPANAMPGHQKGAHYRCFAETAGWPDLGWLRNIRIPLNAEF